MPKFNEPNGNYDKIAFGDSITIEKKNLPIRYNEPCKEDMCKNNIGCRCSDCRFIGDSFLHGYKHGKEDFKK